MDLIPGIACAAHFIVHAREVPKSVDDYISAGRAVQRLWLTLTQLGLFMQPEMTPLIFSRYITEGLQFTTNERRLEDAQQLSLQLGKLIGEETRIRSVFMGRIGAGRTPTARSLRKPLLELKYKT